MSVQLLGGGPAAPERAATVRLLAYVAAASWAAFAVIAVFVALDPGTVIDHGFQRVVASAGRDVALRASWLGPVSEVVARLGSLPVAIAVVAVTAAAFTVWRRTLLPAVLLGGSLFAVAATVGFLKDVYTRPEPYDRTGDLAFSFPSGHAALAVATWGGAVLVLALFAGPRLNRAETVLSLVGVAVAVGVGAAMIARSAHWLSDVVAGIALGTAWLSTVAAVLLTAARWPVVERWRWPRDDVTAGSYEVPARSLRS